MPLTYYDVAEDKMAELTQPLLDEMQDTGLMQYKRNAAIKSITNLHVKRDKEMLNKLFDLLGIK
jgi:hypothetical protein